MQKSVPVPLQQRLQDMRLRMIPAMVFCGAAIGLGILWKNNLAAPTLVGQAEPYEAHITSYKPGVIAELEVTRFQPVKAGDPVGRVLVTDPKILASSLAVIEAEIESLRVGLQPIASQQRTVERLERAAPLLLELPHAPAGIVGRAVGPGVGVHPGQGQGAYA